MKARKFLLIISMFLGLVLLSGCGGNTEKVQTSQEVNENNNVSEETTNSNTNSDVTMLKDGNVLFQGLGKISFIRPSVFDWYYWYYDEKKKSTTDLYYLEGKNNLCSIHMSGVTGREGPWPDVERIKIDIPNGSEYHIADATKMYVLADYGDDIFFELDVYDEKKSEECINYFITILNSINVEK